MGKIMDKAKRFKQDFNVNLGRMMAGDFSMFDKGDRKALLTGGVIGGVLTPAVAFGDVADQLGDAFNEAWNIGLKVAWGLAAVMALVAIIWTIASGSKEVSKPLSWLRRIVLAVIGINLIITVIKWAKGIGGGTGTPKDAMKPAES